MTRSSVAMGRPAQLLTIGRPSGERRCKEAVTAHSVVSSTTGSVQRNMRRAGSSTPGATAR